MYNHSVETFEYLVFTEDIEEISVRIPLTVSMESKEHSEINIFHDVKPPKLHNLAYLSLCQCIRCSLSHRAKGYSGEGQP